MGRSAAELLISQINDPTRPPRILMSRGELIARGSCQLVDGERIATDEPDDKA